MNKPVVIFVKRVSLWGFIIFITLVFFTSLLYQWGYEDYINRVKEESTILDEKKRVRFKPAILFSIESQYFHKHSSYKEKGDSLTNELTGIRLNSLNNAYLAYCYVP